MSEIAKKVKISTLKPGDRFKHAFGVSIQKEGVLLSEPKNCSVCRNREYQGYHVRLDGWVGITCFAGTTQVTPIKETKMAAKKKTTTKKTPDVVVETKKTVRITASGGGEWELEIDKENSDCLSLSPPCDDEVVYPIKELRKVAQAILDHFPEK